MGVTNWSSGGCAATCDMSTHRCRKPCLKRMVSWMRPSQRNQSLTVQRASVAAFQAAVQQSGPSGPGTNGFLLEQSEDLPVRHLPPGAKRAHWWTYLFSCAANNEEPVGSYRTLCRVWDKCFARVLKMGKYGQHPVCKICAQGKDKIATAVSYADKLQASAALGQHYERQWRDRLIYWHMRSHASRAGARWIVIIIDGADQAKFRIMKSVEWPKNMG